jgi:LPXTG-motif cell wall-anchored protein
MDADTGQNAAPWMVVLTILALVAAATVVVNRRRTAS